MATDPVLSDPLLASAGSHVAPGDRSHNLRLGARLFVAADAFVFLAFLFAYLYLRSLNQHGLWRPPHTSPVARARHRHARRDARAAPPRSSRRSARCARAIRATGAPAPG